MLQAYNYMPALYKVILSSRFRKLGDFSVGLLHGMYLNKEEASELFSCCVQIDVQFLLVHAALANSNIRIRRACHRVLQRTWKAVNELDLDNYSELWQRELPRKPMKLATRARTCKRNNENTTDSDLSQ